MVTETARIWSVNLYNPHGEEHMTEQQERLQAAALLREQIRTDGAVYAPETLARGPVQHVLVRHDGPMTVDMASADGTITTWTAEAFARGVDGADHVPDNTDDEGVVWFTIPADVREAGGELRLRHGLDGEVTAYAYADTVDAEKMGYLIAAEITDDVLSIVLLPGTGCVSVAKDTDE